jgi:hypothetical protein
LADSWNTKARVKEHYLVRTAKPLLAEVKVNNTQQIITLPFFGSYNTKILFN